MALSIKKATKALIEAKGVVLYAAQACGVSRQYFTKFMREHPELDEVREEAGEVLLDVGEGYLVQAIEKGDLKTIRWHMERKGKNRGYSTRVENTGADGGPLEYEGIERRIVDADGSDSE